MRRPFALLALSSVLIMACSVSASWGVFHGNVLPFSVDVVDAHTAVVNPNPGYSLPAGIQAGAHIDLPALDSSARTAVAIQGLQGFLPSGQTYQFVMRRGSLSTTVPVTTVPIGTSQRARFTQWIFSGNYLLFAALALLILWRGRGRAAVYMAAWLTLALFGFEFNYGFQFDAILGMCLQSLALIFYALGRISFYLMIETLVGAALTPRTRVFARLCFMLVLVVGTATILGGRLAFVASGWAGLLRPVFGVLFTAGYIVPALVLLFGYGHAVEAQRPHLRWLLLSTAALLVGIFLSNTSVMDVATNEVVQSIFMCLGITGFAYTVLRHRVVDVSVVLDRTLVYGATTALVVGVVAAMNSLALRATLGAGAGLLLQIVVPLALGIVLGRVRSYMDRLVERVFFRAKYQSERALRNFARHCGHIEHIHRLLDAAVAAIRKHTASPAVAIYELKDDGYTCVRQAGKIPYPQSLDMDDAAMVAVRAEMKAVDLADFDSSLGTDGCVFPMTVLGVMRGVLVCANRPGVHFATDEKELLTQVARDVGAAWRILRARDNEEFVWAIAQGKIKPATVRTRAKSLAAAWSGALADT